MRSGFKPRLAGICRPSSLFREVSPHGYSSSPLSRFHLICSFEGQLAIIIIIMVEIVDVKASKTNQTTKSGSWYDFRADELLIQDEIFCGRGALQNSLVEIETKQ